jgi:hypothetical protein
MTNWETGIRTQILRSRAVCPTIGLSPTTIRQVGSNQKSLKPNLPAPPSRIYIVYLRCQQRIHPLGGPPIGNGFPRPSLPTRFVPDQITLAKGVQDLIEHVTDTTAREVTSTRIVIMGALLLSAVFYTIHSPDRKAVAAVCFVIDLEG